MIEKVCPQCDSKHTIDEFKKCKIDCCGEVFCFECVQYHVEYSHMDDISNTEFNELDDDEQY